MKNILIAALLVFATCNAWAQETAPVTDVEAGARIEKIDDAMKSCVDVWATMKDEIKWVKGSKVPPGAVDKAVGLENWWGVYLYACLNAIEGIKSLRQDLMKRKYLETQ